VECDKKSIKTFGRQKVQKVELGKNSQQNQIEPVHRSADE